MKGLRGELCREGSFVYRMPVGYRKRHWHWARNTHVNSLLTWSLQRSCRENLS